MTTTLAPGAVIAGKYRLEKALGKGGFGTVWRAHHENLGCDVALKVMNHEVAANPQAEQRFLREVQATSKILHKYAVPLRDFGRDKDLGCLYFTMDLVQGESLRGILEREGRLDPLRAVRLIAQALEVLAEAHESGFVHRDLKPNNLMVTVDEGQEEVRVLDFGIAKAITTARQEQQGELTVTGTTVGTLSYMSPEQAQGLELTAASDLYSIGVVLFELLSGQKPHQPAANAADARQSTLFKIVGEPPAQLSELAPQLPEALTDVVMRCLSKATADRPEGAGALRAALLKAVEGYDPPEHAETRVEPVPASHGEETADEGTESFGATHLDRSTVEPPPAEETDSFGATHLDQPTVEPPPAEETDSFGATHLDQPTVPTGETTVAPPVAEPPQPKPAPQPRPAPAPVPSGGVSPLAVVGGIAALLVIGVVALGAIGAFAPPEETVADGSETPPEGDPAPPPPPAEAPAPAHPSAEDAVPAPPPAEDPPPELPEGIDLDDLPEGMDEAEARALLAKLQADMEAGSDAAPPTDDGRPSADPGTSTAPGEVLPVPKWKVQLTGVAGVELKPGTVGGWIIDIEGAASGHLEVDDYKYKAMHVEAACDDAMSFWRSRAKRFSVVQEGRLELAGAESLLREYAVDSSSFVQLIVKRGETTFHSQLRGDPKVAWELLRTFRFTD